MESVNLVSLEIKQAAANRYLIPDLVLILMGSLIGCVETVSATPATSMLSVSWSEMEASAVR